MSARLSAGSCLDGTPAVSFDVAFRERFAEPSLPPQDPTPLAAMSHRLQTPEGKKRYALRKQTPEPVLGIIKSVLGFRQFLLRDLGRVRGKGTPARRLAGALVTMAWNMKRAFVLAAAI